MASSGTARMTSSTSSRMAAASANARLPGHETAESLAARRVARGDRGHGPVGPGEGDPERRPDRSRPDDPDDRRLSRPRVDVGMGMVGRVDLVAVAMVPGGGGARSIPRSASSRRESSISRSVESGASCASVGDAGRARRSSQALIDDPRGGPGPGRGTLARIECSHPARTVLRASPRPVRRPPIPGAGPARPVPTRGDRRPDRARQGTHDPQGPPRERPPPRRRRHRRCGRRRAPRLLAARSRRRCGDPVHAGPGRPPGFHRRPGRRGPGRHARRDGRPRRRSRRA